ncbi:MAG: hypothetical protein H6970_11060 [Gammaproteobacteria bacterium]|nr:hypothetical protein [Gammaproteobacteria bacterium]MCP5425589.1 hypothetical protein [Gammaproteobacteria bacterium]MCP5459011.1 hypothetical protein [Gammaproteobacteria bacterium]
MSETTLSETIDVEVATLVFGGAAALPPIEPVTVCFATETVLIRELIARTVAEQIQVLLESRKELAAHTQDILSRQYLSDEEIEQQARQGRVHFPTPQEERTIEVQTEIDKALRGFGEQRFFISIDGQQPQSLDDKVLLSRYSQIVFIRLMPLVGG